MLVQETSVLYQYETSTGLVWKTFGNGKVQPKYEGEITYVEPNGQGTYTYLDGRKYIVEWKNVYEHGEWTFTFSNGVKWVGEFSSRKHQYLKFTRYNTWHITVYDKKGRISEILLVRNIPTKSLISEDLFSRQKTSVLMI